MKSMMSGVGRRSLVLACAAWVAACLLPQGAEAVTGWWNTGTTNRDWTNGTWWVSGVIPQAAGDIAWFTNNITALRTVILSNSVSVGVIYIGDENSSHSHTLGGATGVLTFDNNGQGASVMQTSSGAVSTISMGSVVLNDDLALTNANTALSSRLVLSSDISGAAGKGLSVGGPGIVLLSGANSTFDGGVTLTGGTLWVGSDNALGTGLLTMGGGVLTNSVARILTNDISMSAAGTIANGVGMTLSGIVSGSGALSKTGSGTLTLNGSNTYSGGTAMSMGALSVSNASALGTGAITLNVGGQLLISAAMTLTNDLTSAGGTLNCANDLNLPGTISGSGVLIKSGAGTLTLPASNTYSGGTTNAGGTLTIGSDEALGSGPVYFSGTSTLRSSDATRRTITNVVTVKAGQTLMIGGDADFTLLNVLGSVGAAANDIISNGVGRTVYIGTFDKTGSSFTKQGEGNMIITNMISNGAQLNVRHGALAISNGFGVIMLCNTTFQRGGQFGFNGTMVRNNGNFVQLHSGGFFGWGTHSGFGGANDLSFTSGAGTGNSGKVNLIWGYTNAVGYAGYSLLAYNDLSGNATSNGVLVLGHAMANGTVTYVNPIDFNGALREVRVNRSAIAAPGDVDAILSGDLTDAVVGSGGGLLKSGAGVLVLAGGNSYGGATVVSNGTLLVISGMTNSAVTVVDGAAFGTATTTVARVASLALDEGAKLVWKFDGAAQTSGRIDVTGTLTLPASATLDVSGEGDLPPSRVIVSADSVAGATELSGWTITGAPAGARPVLVGSQVVLRYLKGTLISVL